MVTRTTGKFGRLNPRALMGVVLIAVSALGVWGLMRVTTSSNTVVVATRLLVEGQQIQAGDVRTDSTGSGADLGPYASKMELVVGKVVTRVIRPGELVPAASIGEVSETLETTMVIDLMTKVASDLSDGAIVDVWAAPAKTGSSVTPRESGDPRIVLARARLAHREVAAATATSGARVEIVLPRTAVADVLAAIAAGDAMTVVASSGGLAS